MTNDQCIEVATKIWGVDPEFAARFKQQYIHEVNSWEGFGRTVDSMRNNEKEWPWFLANLQRAMFYKDCIERSHLAALEAMNENKD